MRRLGRWLRVPLRALRTFALWGLPPLVLALVALTAFAGWLVASPAGTRWALRTLAPLGGAQVQGVQGTLLHGLELHSLVLDLPEIQVNAQDLRLQVAWRELLQQRTLHVVELSAAELAVGVRTGTGQPAAPHAEAFSLPPVPLDVQLDRLAVGRLSVAVDGTPVCPARVLPAALVTPPPGSGRDAGPGSGSGSVGGTGTGSPPGCTVQIQANATADAQAIRARLQGSGSGLQLQADLTVYPGAVFPLGPARLALDLPDGASLRLTLDPQAAAADGSRVLQAALQAQRLVLDPWLPHGVGHTLLDLTASSMLSLGAAQDLRDLTLQVAFGGASRWNGEPLAGHLRLARLARAGGPLFDPRAATSPGLPGLTLSGLDLNVTLGPDHLQGKGDFAADAGQLALTARLPVLEALWPGLPGGLELTAESAGSLAHHRATTKLQWTPEGARDGEDRVGHAPLALALTLDGGWSTGQGWRGTLTQLQLQHAGLVVHGSPFTLAIDAAGAWQVGAATLDASLDGKPLLQVRHEASSGAAGQWATRGRIDSLVVTPARIEEVRRWLTRGAAPQDGAVHTMLSSQSQRSRLEVRLNWDLAFKGALRGDLHLQRTAGDLVVPGDVSLPLGLDDARLDVAIRPAQGVSSLVTADLQVRTAKLGRLRVQADTPVHATAGGGFALRAQDVKHLRVQADSEDLAWINLLLDEAVEVGGTLHADVRGQNAADGSWTFSGPVSGEGLRILSADQGVRLLDGTLQAHLADSRFTLDGLHFPALRRVTPKEWRTATWIAENPDAQNGSLDLTGWWDFAANQGQVRAALRRYPILQRADRYAMMSGAVTVQVGLPQIQVTGKLTADAGWFDLNVLNDVPTLDGDVVILQPGRPAAPPPPAVPLDISADLTIDLGPRFYLTGYGVNSGLVGSLDLRLRRGRLTALGALRTRGGSIDAYGQHLQLRRGTVTFQGDVTNPVLSIEALRTDVAVQAGVRVAGTARRPRIDLVSYPDVSEVQKLTWLLLGHGPDDGGTDVSLLFSVGSSFLSGGEPFYKRFGLDELSMRSGELGSTGSVLPAQSVVSSLDTGASPIEQRFVVASKTLTDDLRASLEQSLAQTGTVARLSYRLLRNLRAELTVGTTNGLALVYRWFSRD